jgi:heme/copper-type cytochrome/quinol oxidase subunit 2
MRTLLTTLALLGVPRLALACPVCFGQSDAPLSQAIQMGVIAMLVVVVGVLGSFATFIVYLARRARTVDAAEAAAATVPHPGSDPQEGTVRC